jgi:hypothetical protein
MESSSSKQVCMQFGMMGNHEMVIRWERVVEIVSSLVQSSSLFKDEERMDITMGQKF